MAKVFDIVAAHKTAGCISLPKVYERLEAQPVDPTEVFTSLEDAKLYCGETEGADSRALNGTAFVGQELSIVPTDTSYCVSRAIIQNDSKLDAVVTVATAWQEYDGEE